MRSTSSCGDATGEGGCCTGIIMCSATSRGDATGEGAAIQVQSCSVPLAVEMPLGRGCFACRFNHAQIISCGAPLARGLLYGLNVEQCQ